ncbi:aspartate aminotransferase family protein [Novosphingobium cyanobacteriorum]|uniref:Aspartate aminotransferase family protein n=1 Tax=Novosphingobium cyanobacteriorum TaxID=3024215 RepID=A0ABT6CMH4_9SPHN|nr:aspartate aminotransferase family protein [Novosphingobium cyanobacteriorum]MDF8334729.1 aspartate aminotransferase family protein [Novosphingobium cyanobacteriorum]
MATPPTIGVRNYDIPALRELDVAHHLPAQSSYKLQQDLGGSRIITHAQGSTIYDGEGHAILDGMAGLWCVNVGYGRPELAEVAARQMEELPFYNTFFRTATVPPIELATKLAGLLGGKLQHVFFNNSGSESNDTVFRLVRTYWGLKGEPNRTVFISRHNAYHGSTVASASLGGMTFMHAQGGLPIPGIEHVMQPYPFGEGFGEDPEAFATRAAQAIEDRILAVGPENVAAFIGEPVQGAGGVIIPPPGYWQKVEAICRKYGILLVSDEVICGFGRLGEWFGFQHYGISPDIVSMAKGLSSGYLPISATGVSSEIVEVLRASGEEFVHGYTYSGHPVSAAVALRNLQIIEDEHLVDRVREDVGPYLNAALQRLADQPLVGEVRSIGLLGAVEIVAEKGTNKRHGTGGQAGPIVRDHCIAGGLMVRAIRDSIVMSPPLVITHEEIDRLVGIIGAALDASMEQLAAL